MARKWFQLVDVDGNAVTSAASVYVDIEDVNAFLWEVKQEYSDSYLAEIAPSDLSVFENRAATEALAEDASIESLGGPENDALIVQIRTSTVIEDEILKSIRQNLDIDEWHVGGIDLNIHKVESDFPEWFYVRKESLDIVKVFKDLMEANLNVVCVGTHGVGKSMLVVLFAFYMALIQKKCVVLFRKLKGKGFSILYLDVEKKRYWRKDGAAIRDIYLLENRDFELCLDGLDYSDVGKHFGTLARFRLLATVQYTIKNNDICLRRCLVPFWSLSDLHEIGAYHEWSEHATKDRYFYSGGNLRDFLSERNIVERSINEAAQTIEPADLELLNNLFWGTANHQVDHLRMAGIRANDHRDSDKYQHIEHWVCCVTSEYALRQLGNIVKPSYYEELWSKGRMLGDDGLMSIAFENYVHTLARDGKKIELQVREYDRVKARQHCYVALEFEAKSCCNDGKDEAECDEAMKRLASSSDDYWYPSRRCLQTIDSVAKLNVGGQSNVVGLIQITQSDHYKIDSKALDKYAGFFPNGSRYIAFVPNKETCDKFRLDPASPDTNVQLDVAYIPNWCL